MRVTIIRTAFDQIKNQDINLGGRKFVSLLEILKMVLGKDFKLLPSEQCWWKKTYEQKFDKSARGLNSQLDQTYHDKCTIVLSPVYPPPDIESKILKISEKKLEKKAETQQLEKELETQRRERKRRKIPRSTELRTQAKLALVRKQRRKRLSLQKADKDKNTPES